MDNPRYIPRKSGDYYFVFDSVHKSWDPIPLVNFKTAKKFAELMNYDDIQSKLRKVVNTNPESR